MRDKDAINIIEFNKKCSNILRKKIIKENDLNRKMYLIEYYLHFCTNNLTGYYSDPVVEKELWKYSNLIDFKKTKNVKKNTALIVMSEAYKIGGHTFLVNKWIQTDKSRQYSVILTEPWAKKSIPDFLKKSVEESGGNIYVLKETGDNVSKAKQLLEIAQGFENVFLHIHMYDVIPVIAFAHKNWTTPIIFCHHANFLFTVGMSVTDMMFTLCDYDNIRALENRGVRKARVLYYPREKTLTESNCFNKEDILSELADKYNIRVDKPIVITMGSDFKYSKTEKYDFAEFVNSVVRDTNYDINFILIGANPNSERWANLKKSTKGCAQAIGIQERETVKKWMSVANAFVTCFPMNASGANDTRKYGAKVFRFSPTGRNNEIIPVSELYTSIYDMKLSLVKFISNQTTIVNKEYDYSELSFDNEAWCKLLDNYIELVNEHCVCNFDSKQIIDEEEIINIQLLRRDNYPFMVSKRKYPFLWVFDFCTDKIRKFFYKYYNKNKKE